MRQISNQRQDRGKHIADVLEEKKEKWVKVFNIYQNNETGA